MYTSVRILNADTKQLPPNSLIYYQFQRRETEASDARGHRPASFASLGNRKCPLPHFPSQLPPCSPRRPRRTGRATGKKVSAKWNNKKTICRECKEAGRGVLWCAPAGNYLCCVLFRERKQGEGQEWGYCLQGRRYLMGSLTVPAHTYPRPTHIAAITRDKLALRVKRNERKFKLWHPSSP